MNPTRSLHLPVYSPAKIDREDRIRDLEAMADRGQKPDPTQARALEKMRAELETLRRERDDAAAAREAEQAEHEAAMAALRRDVDAQQEKVCEPHFVFCFLFLFLH
jgi:peptidoglycan hydrolase CwlO-like protein